MRRLIWLLVPIGVLLGIALGLFAAWGPLSGVPVAADPSTLRRQEKERYIRLVASAYAEERDLRLARERLDRLKAGSPALWVAELAREEEREGKRDSAGRLARLALALAITDPELVRLAATPTPTLIPTATAGAGGTARWLLLDQETLSCAEMGEGSTPLLVIRTVDEQGSPVAGIGVQAVDESGAPALLRTDGDGRASTPFDGLWSFTLHDGTTFAFSSDGLVADCAGADAASPHAVQVILQRQTAP